VFFALPLLFKGRVGEGLREKETSDQFVGELKVKF